MPGSVALIAAARAWRVALIWPARAGRCGQGEAQEGFEQLEVAMPSLAREVTGDWAEGVR